MRGSEAALPSRGRPVGLVWVWSTEHLDDIIHLIMRLLIERNATLRSCESDPARTIHQDRAVGLVGLAVEGPGQGAGTVSGAGFVALGRVMKARVGGLGG